MGVKGTYRGVRIICRIAPASVAVTIRYFIAGETVRACHTARVKGA